MTECVWEHSGDRVRFVQRGAACGKRGKEGEGAALIESLTFSFLKIKRRELEQIWQNVNIC